MMKQHSDFASGIRFQLVVGVLVALPLTFAATSGALAQNYSSPGSSWSSSWGFSSTSDRTLALQRANLVREAKKESAPSTVIYQDTYNDNRSNYIENITDEGSVTASLGDMVEHLGDEIGTNTNSIGSMNTGEIYVDGDNNDITATNQALSDGCVDGSVNTSLLDASSSMDALPGLSAGVGGRSTSCN